MTWHVWSSLPIIFGLWQVCTALVLNWNFAPVGCPFSLALGSVDINQTHRPAALKNLSCAPLIYGLYVCLPLNLKLLTSNYSEIIIVLIITENEDSDQSVESNKSKSSNEEKQSRGRRGNGNNLCVISWTCHIK